MGGNTADTRYSVIDYDSSTGRIALGGLSSDSGVLSATNPPNAFAGMLVKGGGYFVWAK
jgi:hypothetical protein